MSHPRVPEKVLFFLAVTETQENLFKRIISEYFGDLGMVIFQTPPYDFSLYTDYYEEEMGKPLLKSFYFFERLFDPDYLVELKHHCYRVERLFCDEEGRRRINLDPGYLTLAKVVLATFKDYAHRVYIGNSVFAEVTLIYRDGAYQALPWTYPDYREPEHLTYFLKAREYYRSLRRKILKNAD